MHKFLALIFLVVVVFSVNAQTRLDSLERQIMEVQLNVENINLNLEKAKSKFQRGIFVATLGYTMTIAGGLMLGRENDEIGQGLLIAGGVTGATGTFLLVDAFKYLGRTRRTRHP